MMITHLGYSLALYLIALVLLIAAYRSSARFQTSFYNHVSELMDAAPKMIVVIVSAMIAIWLKNDNFVEFMIHVAVFMSYLQSVVIAVLIFYGLKAVRSNAP